MDKEQYQKLGLRAKFLAEASDEPEDQFYWQGYSGGLRRLYYGNRFGTNHEHKQWLALSDKNDTDLRRKALDLGYKAGLIYKIRRESWVLLSKIHPPPT